MAKRAHRWQNGAQYRQGKRVQKAHPRAAVNIEEQIFKVQRPLFDSTGQMTKILIYNEDRSIMSEVIVDQGTMAEIFYANDPEGIHKLYVLATTNNLGQLCIGSFIPEDEWPEW